MQLRRHSLAVFAWLPYILALTIQTGCGGGGGEAAGSESRAPSDAAPQPEPPPMSPQPVSTPSATPRPGPTALATRLPPEMPTASAWALVTGPGAEHEALLLRSADDGRTWDVSVVFPGEPLQVEFAGPRDGWVVMRESLWSTNDGGASWADVTDALPLPMDPATSTQLSLLGTSFADAARGVVFGRHGGSSFEGRALLASTQDGGATWRHWGTETNWRVGGGCLTRSGVGVARGLRPSDPDGLTLDRTHLILRTKDYGRSWEETQYAPITGEYTCSGESTIWTAGELDLRNDGYLGYSPDGSLEWVERELPRSVPKMKIVSAGGGTHAWAIAVPLDTGSGIHRTDDGGETWTRLSVPLDPAESVRSAEFALDGRGMAVVGHDDRQRLVITADDGSTWEPSSVPVDIQYVVDLVLLE